MAERRVSRWYFGGLASSGAACCTHPLDLLKVRGWRTAPGSGGGSERMGSGRKGMFNGSGGPLYGCGGPTNDSRELVLRDRFAALRAPSALRRGPGLGGGTTGTQEDRDRAEGTRASPRGSCGDAVCGLGVPGRSGCRPGGVRGRGRLPGEPRPGTAVPPELTALDAGPLGSVSSGQGVTEAPWPGWHPCSRTKRAARSPALPAPTAGRMPALPRALCQAAGSPGRLRRGSGRAQPGTGSPHPPYAWREERM